jgi:hypothetical protein
MSNYLTIFLISTCIISLIFSIIALVSIFLTAVRVLALEKATHTVQYVPVDNDWAASDKEVDEVNKEIKEERDIEFLNQNLF